MKKIVLSLCVFNIFMSFGQNAITISPIETPHVGLAYLNINQGLFNNFYEGASGENRIFDPIFFEEANIDTTIFKEASSSPFSEDFPLANMYSYVSGDSTVSYLNKTDTVIEEVGKYDLIEAVGLNAQFYNTNPLLKIKLPINYGDSFLDTGVYYTDKYYYPQGFPSGTIPDADTAYFDSVYMNRIITRNSEIDAWGTLLTPDGEFNVLRQRIHEIDYLQPVFRLTIVYFGFPFTIWQAIDGFDFTDTLTKFKYLTNEHPYEMAEIVRGPGGVLRSAKYTKVYDASKIELDNDISVNCFPNPSSEMIKIESKNEIIKYAITSIDGKIILEKSIRSNSENIDLTNFKTGEYILTIETVKGKISKKISKI
jgi:hypothetical protein